MKTGERIKVKHNGNSYIGEIIDIRKVQNCIIFRIDVLQSVFVGTNVETILKELYDAYANIEGRVTAIEG